MAKLAKMKVPPCEMFRTETDKYSKFDETVKSLMYFPHCDYQKKCSEAWSMHIDSSFLTGNWVKI